MSALRITGAANRLYSAAGSVLLAATLLATMSLTMFQGAWITFLAGVLAAAFLAAVSSTVNARWTIARRTAQLNATRAKLATESRLRARAEEALARTDTLVRLIDERLPAMLVYVDVKGKVLYHNHAYTRWIGKDSAFIDGQRLPDVVGDAAYGEIESRLASAMQGRDVRYERVQVMPNGESCRLNVQYLPSYSEDGKVAGVFAILTDITRARDLASKPQDDTQSDAQGRERLMSALKRGEFSLYCQSIAPLGHGVDEAAFYEVLLRMNEEENEHLPPGAFLAQAEELGLLHELDRWTVRKVVEFAARAIPRAGAIYVVRVSAPTLVDPDFRAFVRESLEARATPGHSLCLELTEADLLRQPVETGAFISAMQAIGCQVAVSGFGRNALSLNLLKQLRVDLLKLDGAIVLNMLRSSEGLARVKAINQAAHEAGIRTVAECVENPRTRTALQRIDIDFAQGSGISAPRLMGVADECEAPAIA